MNISSYSESEVTPNSRKGIPNISISLQVSVWATKQHSLSLCVDRKRNNLTLTKNRQTEGEQQS